MHHSPSATATARVPGLFRVVKISGSGFVVTLAGVTNSPQIHVFGLWEGAGALPPQWATEARWVRLNTGWGQRDRRSILDIHPTPWGKGHAITRATLIKGYYGDNAPTPEEIASNGDCIRRINSPAELAAVGIYATQAEVANWAAKEAAAKEAAAKAEAAAEERRAAYLAKAAEEKANAAARSAVIAADYANALARAAANLLALEERKIKIAEYYAAKEAREAKEAKETAKAEKTKAAKASPTKASPTSARAAWSDYQAEQAPAAPFGGFGGAFAGL